MKKTSLSVLSILLLSSCSLNMESVAPTAKNKNVIIAYSDFDKFDGSDFIKKLNQREKEINFVNLNLGITSDLFKDRLSEKIEEVSPDNVIIIGENTYNHVRDIVKGRQGMKFTALDNRNEEEFSNLTTIQFAPEEIGYLSGRLTAKGSVGNIGYFSTFKSSYENRELYGFFQGVEKENSNLKISTRYMEEIENDNKVKDYLKKFKDEGCSSLFASIPYSNEIVSENSALRTIYFDYNALENAKYQVQKSYTKAIDRAIEVIKGETSEKKIELSLDEGYTLKGFPSSMKDDLKDVKRLNSYEELKTYDSYLMDDSLTYSPKYTVRSGYHEAIPKCSEANDWKYAPRPGADDGKKPASWKALGVWATIYQQDGFSPCKNTGIEFKDMKLYGYSKRRGWVFIEHANPVGSFYDENFTNDANKDFSSNMFNYSDQKITKIKLDSRTAGYNYHPFGSQNDLEALDLLDIEYVISTMKIRLITWDDLKASDMENAKYVANIGADWWSYKGATWASDWSANRDVCVGQFRTITRNWKTLYMSSIPLDLYDSVASSLTLE